LLRAESVKSLKRDWSRSRLNPKPSPPREVVVEEDEPDFDPEDKSEVLSPSAEESLAPSLVKASPPSPPATLGEASSSTEVAPSVRRDIWNRPLQERTAPRLRVALDYHHVIHVTHKKWGEVTYEGITGSPFGSKP
jgi:hypothetical protein